MIPDYLKILLIGRAVMTLRPNAKFTMNGKNVEDIIWLTDNVEPITKEELDAKVLELEIQFNNLSEQ